MTRIGTTKRNISTREIEDHSHYHSTDHRRWRKEILERDNYLCQEHLRKGISKPGRIADHIIPIKQGGSKYDLSNGQTLCDQCHAKKSSMERNDRQ